MTSNPSVITDRVLQEILAERIAQDTKWGEQNHPDNTGSTFYLKRAVAARRNCQLAADAGMTAWDLVLLEEVYEALAEADPAKLRAELLQVAAVAAAWVEAIDRRAPAAAASEACGKCKQPFDSADTRFDGRARYYLTSYCKRCVDNCHEGGADHRCVICA